MFSIVDGMLNNRAANRSRNRATRVELWTSMQFEWAASIEFPVPMIFAIRPSSGLLRIAGIALVICIALASPILARTEYPKIIDEPARSPQEELKAFHLPPGFEIQL